jgi:nucleotide-binding universal stress UspA family protein
MTNVVAVLSDPATARACLDAAVVAASAVPEGSVEAFHARVAPESLIMVSEEVMTDERRADLVAWLDKRSQALQEILRQWIGDHATEKAPIWNEINGGTVESIIAARGKTADLVVIVRPGEAEGKDALYAAIFETGKPLLLVPPTLGGAPHFGHHMAIAWKASDQAERAVTASIPWLKRAERISLLLVGKEGEPPRSPDDVFALLDPHRITAEPLLLDRGGDSVGIRLLRAAHEIGADCLVMGAYRHNRMIEMILGGVTHHMLGHADLPVFMLH